MLFGEHLDKCRQEARITLCVKWRRPSAHLGGVQTSSIVRSFDTGRLSCSNINS